MQPHDEIREREVETFLLFVMGPDDGDEIAERAFHVLREYDVEDFRKLSDTLLDCNGTGSFPVLGRDVADQAEAVEMLHDAGHEIVCHGHRHVSFGSLSYDRAHHDLTTALAAIEDATGIVPTGFFAPFKDVSDGTLAAAAELGFDWVLGHPESTVPDDVQLVEAVYPHDSVLLKRGHSPKEVFEQMSDEARAGATVLCHPNLLEYHGAREVFAEWVSDVRPVAVETQLREGGVGIVLDCLQPIRIE